MTAIESPTFAQPERTVRVWDPVVRLFHWSLVGCFVAAMATGDELTTAHIVIGYAAAALIAIRVVWGFVGTRHARFADFVYRPASVIRYLRATLSMRAPRHLGHNPAGGAMVVALLIAVAAIAATGHMLTLDAFWGEEWLEDLHVAIVYATIGLIVLHISGVLVASIEHRENLVRAMFTGRKRA